MTQLLLTSKDRTVIANQVQRRFRDSAGQARLEGELRRLALDILGQPETEGLEPECREAIQRATGAAVAASVEPLVARFIAEMTRGIASLPPETRKRLLAGCRPDLGFD